MKSDLEGALILIPICCSKRFCHQFAALSRLATVSATFPRYSLRHKGASFFVFLLAAQHLCPAPGNKKPLLAGFQAADSWRILFVFRVLCLSFDLVVGASVVAGLRPVALS